MENKYHIIFMVLVTIILVYNTTSVIDMKKRKEHMEGLDAEALQNIASIYNKKHLIVDNLTVTNKADIKGIKADYYALSGAEISNATAKSLAGDGIFYRTGGQAAIGVDDNFDVINVNNKNRAHVRAGSLETTGEIKTVGKIRTYNDIIFDGKNKWVIHHPGARDTNTNLYITPANTPGKEDWDFNAKGTILAKNSIIHTGDYSIKNEAGRLQFKRGAKNLVSFPNSEHDAPVFRGTGLMYTNKQFGNRHSYQTHRAKIYDQMSKDPEKYKNLMYLGGTDNYNAQERWNVGNVRHYKDGRWLAHQPVMHGHGAICKHENCSHPRDII
jgi:hypothetical protein